MIQQRTKHKTPVLVKAPPLGDCSVEVLNGELCGIQTEAKFIVTKYPKGVERSRKKEKRKNLYIRKHLIGVAYNFIT